MATLSAKDACDLLDADHRKRDELETRKEELMSEMTAPA